VIILGVDPGSWTTGFGLIECVSGRTRYLASGRLVATSRAELAAGLVHLAEALQAVVGTHRPELVALEKPFHGVNARSAIVLAEARGALLVTLARGGLAIEEYAPASVKSAVAGHGRADKGEVARMVGLQLGIATRAMGPDESDALAVALCAAARRPLQESLARATAGVLR
jgi:crossover junction endodeoxyribonuclease RuvC